MKFSLAVLFLTQHVPVLSKKRSTSGSKSYGGDRVTPYDDLRIADIIQATTSKQEIIRRRILSTTNKRITERKLGMRFNNGALKNIPSAKSSNEDEDMICDPTLFSTGDVHADIGILSCTADQWCQPFTGSPLGGICKSMMPPSVDSKQEERSLVRIHTIGGSGSEENTQSQGGWCDVSPAVSFSLDCDCSGVDSSGTGSVVCPESTSMDLSMFGCGIYVNERSQEYVFENHVLKEIKFCDVIKGGYERTACVTSYGPEDCTFVFNDQTCNSCAVTQSFYTFDCSNVQGGMAGSTLEDLFPTVTKCEASYQGSSTCTSLCPVGSEIPEEAFYTNVTIPGYGDVPCAYLWLAEEMKYIPESYCDVYSEAAQSGCCFPKTDSFGPSRAEIWEAAGGSPLQMSLTVTALSGLAFFGLMV